MEAPIYVGVMSGTSMDAIDAVLVSIGDKKIETLGHHSSTLPPSLVDSMKRLCIPGDNEIQLSRECDIAFAQEAANTVNELLKQHNLSAEQIKAIGSHGQTIRHNTDCAYPFSLQIGNPSVIADLTGITTVGDFRMADIAAGGQGAPIACLLHEEVFRSNTDLRIILNLGGIANITLLEPGRKTIGFDTGPANTLMDQWMFKCKKRPYDKCGEWARQGQVIPELLNNMMNDPFIKLPAPKSTGREYFNLDWLSRYTNNQPYSEADIQRTLLEYTATSVSNAITHLETKPCSIFICGGGVYNSFLVERIGSLLPAFPMRDTNELGIHTQQVEATAFALLAHKAINHLPGNLPGVTGASKPKILGGIYLTS